MRAFLFLFLCCFITCQRPQQFADTIFVHGNIYTMDQAQPKAEGMAVLDGKIIAIGHLEAVMQFKGENTRVMELHGSTISPGFIDSHAHFMGLGYAKLNLDLAGTTSYAQIVQKIRDRVAHTPPGAWIVGRGWHQDKWDSVSGTMVRGFPTHALLSEVSPDHPVFLMHASGHLGLANGKAMELAGITSATGYSGAGDIFEDEVGNLTGIFNESAMELIASHIPKNEAQQDQLAFDAATKECLSHGITSFHDAGVGQSTIDLYKKNIADGNMKVRIYAMLDGSDRLLLSSYFVTGPAIGLGQDMLTIRSIKLYSDGALGSRGAWLLDAYSDMPDVHGHSIVPPDTLYRVSTDAIRYGFQVGTHAIGDRANREVLNQYQKVFDNQECLPSDFRFRVEHAQHLHPDDISRFHQMGVIAAMQAIHMSSDRPWAIDRLGQQRIEDGAYVWQKLLKSGAVIINGTDAPVEPIDPMACFYASVSRKTLTGIPPGGYEPSQKMTREQALRSYTLDAAFGAFEENIKGSLEPGKYADFVLFDQDFMQIEEDNIPATKVLMTVVNGEVVYTDPTYSSEK
ncbi:MAG: amidohydrolase [Cyclobacteriaceae bacterium]|nr:amidohydrolase [Cyclobacteriaceae bacterium]